MVNINWDGLGQWAVTSAVPLAALVITGLLIAAWPQVQKLLELHIGASRLATIESVLGQGVRAAEQLLPGKDGEAKKQFVITWAATILAGFHIVLPVQQMADMIEAAYVKEKMAGLKLPVLTAETLGTLTPLRPALVIGEGVNGSTLTPSTAQ